MKSLNKLTAGIMAVIMLIALAAYDTKEAGAIVYAAEKEEAAFCSGISTNAEIGKRSLFSLFGKSEEKEEKESAEDVLQYEMTSIKWDNKQNKFVMEGYFYNASQTYDIFDFSNTQIVVVDANELEMFTINVNEKVQSAMILSPGGTWNYNMTAKSLKYAADEYELSYGIHALIDSEYYYAECEGVGCEICGKTAEDSSISSNITNNNSTTDGSSYTCPRCAGTGNCRACNGSGTYYNSAEGKWKNCAVCKKEPGVCQTCGGSGIVSQSAYNKAIENDNAIRNKNSNNTENQYVCSWCKGTGVCKECGGSGKNNAASIVLQSLGCTLCDKTGKCAKCGGDGWASY